MKEQQQGYWQGDQATMSVPAQQNTPETSPAQSNYTGYDLAQPQNIPQTTQVTEELNWEAAEYTHHDKSFGWFLVFGLVVVVIGGVSVMLQAWTFLALVVVMAVAFAVFALRPPRTLHYTLNNEGLTIDEKFYDFHEFRAFGVVSDGKDYSISLVPVKRFMPAISLYFEQKDGEKIVDALGSHLPMEPLSQDFVDVLMRRLRF